MRPARSQTVPIARPGSGTGTLTTLGPGTRCVCEIGVLLARPLPKYGAAWLTRIHSALERAGLAMINSTIRRAADTAGRHHGADG